MYRMKKEEYIQRINESPLFSLDKQREAIAYRREALKVVEYIFGYLLCVNEDLYSQYGLEITETVKRCIKFYELGKGEFLHYFLSSWKIEFARIKAKEVQDSRLGGLHITEDDRRKVRKIIKYAQSNGKDYYSEDFAENVSMATGIAKEEIYDLIELADTKVVSDIEVNEDGDSFSVFDMVSCSDYTQENEADEKEAVVLLLKRIEKFYNSRQDRQKPILSMVITAKIYEQILEKEPLLQELKKCDFYSREVELHFTKNKAVPTARQIADIFGVSEQSLSRTWNKFISLL